MKKGQVIFGVIRGVAKGLFPGVTAIVEAGKNIKENMEAETPETKEPTHKWASIVSQVLAAAFIWYLVQSGKIDVSQALVFLGIG